MYGLARNIRVICYQCNNLCNCVGHSIVVVILAGQIAREAETGIKTVLRAWGLIRVPTGGAARKKLEKFLQNRRAK